MKRLDDRNVQAARRERLAGEIASRTGLSLSAVRGRLGRAHGSKLLRNLFAGAWEDQGNRRASAARRPTKDEQRGPRPPSRAPSPERTIHRVRQRFTTSCGVAVVAMFARVSHEEAMAALFPKGGRVFFTHLHQLKRALDHFGIRYGPRWSRFVSWSKIPTTSLVKVKWHANGQQGFHWVIFQRRKDGGWALIDPEPGRPGTQRLNREEMADYAGVTYLPVEAALPRSR